MVAWGNLLYASDEAFDTTLRAVLKDENYSFEIDVLSEDEAWQRLSMQLDAYSNLLKTSYSNNN
ncbi:hypothetical protein [Fibrivirga algicola]|jgi:hypothetical protein|uniref:DUF695 domain-containing protein n=1 Tax=Fibrivirga algicola TaxID=2950420 RepID=A0ABX0QM68_9BACT|nr:hypothetical protein [Fibrivirga algicola]NID13554.1 hypothetical protein [Fibrivirga algicola]